MTSDDIGARRRDRTPPEPRTAAVSGGFGYFSAEARCSVPLSDIDRLADRLAAAPAALRPSEPAAAFLSFALHDLCSPVWSDPAGPAQAAAGTDPLSRESLEHALLNLRRGSFDLDSLYGEEGDPGLRDPASPDRMRLARGDDGASGMPWLSGPETHGAAATDAFAPRPATPEAIPRARSADRRNAADPTLREICLAALILHNRAVEQSDAHDPAVRFRDARCELRFLLQWLLLNDALPALAGEAAAARAIDGGAAMFRRFAARRGRGVPPLPLEVMATLGPLIALHRGGARPDAEALRRILRLERRLGAPSAQSALRAIAAARGARGAGALTPAELTGPDRTALIGPSMAEATPLGAYLLREAVERGEEGRLGPLGADLLAETLAGAILKDPGAYWSRPGDRGGRWSPEDCEIRHPDGAPILTVAGLLAAAGLG